MHDRVPIANMNVYDRYVWQVCTGQIGVFWTLYARSPSDHLCLSITGRLTGQLGMKADPACMCIQTYICMLNFMPIDCV